jgi:hypothetical protein
MNKNSKKALDAFFQSLNYLRSNNILKNNRDFTSQLGEWLVEQLFNGVRSQIGNQPGWDVKSDDGSLIQVKTHAKALSTSARWSMIQNVVISSVDYYIILVFTPSYELREFYQISREDCMNLILKSKNKKTLYWNNLSQYRLYRKDFSNSYLELLDYFSFK